MKSGLRVKWQFAVKRVIAMKIMLSIYFTLRIWKSDKGLPIREHNSGIRIDTIAFSYLIQKGLLNIWELF